MATPDWKGLFNWSMKYQDGTRQGEGVEPMSAEDRAWFEEAMKHHTVDITQRMATIKQSLDKSDETAETVQQKEALLEELMEIVENIDYARDLTKVGGLGTLMTLLNSPHPSIRSRAAEVAAACVQINPPVQQWFMQGGALPKLIKLLYDADPTCRQKGLLAVSCLIRNNPAGLNAFLADSGVDRLAHLFKQPEPRIQRKALQLLTYIAGETTSAVSVPKLFPVLLKLIDSEEKDLREAALALLVQLARDPDAMAEFRKDPALEQKLRQKRMQLTSQDVEDLDSQREELEHIDRFLDLLEKGPAAQTAARRRDGRALAEAPQQKPVLALTGPPAG